MLTEMTSHSAGNPKLAWIKTFTFFVFLKMWFQNVFKRQLGRENKYGKDYDIVFISNYLVESDRKAKSCIFIPTHEIESRFSVNMGLNMMNE